MRRFYPFLLSGVAALTLASCGGGSETASNPPAAPALPSGVPTSVPSAVPSAIASAITNNPVTAAVTGFTSLQDVVTKTKTAVQSGNFEEAKTEFAKFEGAWKPLQAGVKTKFPDAYKAIEDGMGSVSQAIDAKDKTKALEGLGSLVKNIALAAKPSA